MEIVIKVVLAIFIGIPLVYVFGGLLLEIWRIILRITKE